LHRERPGEYSSETMMVEGKLSTYWKWKWKWK